MRAIILPAFALALGTGILAAPQEAHARFSPERIQAPSLVEDVACVTRHVRTVRPNGRVVYRTVRRCGVPAWQRRVERCRIERVRVVRPFGGVTYRTVRRCR
ncbi:hypothetical protein [Microvirga arsenatis]|uniref:UrcA family protein n=1 Tax=Microvirga arsenatis TaxID=2692265 RepID=A0ABW9YY52_9HYPH|nr:hypothetical protein [Microvirga arsenatis]NBJ10460.1 hypothetical protein [Microvirga arsenatis]NBJ24641.1 hypothetical protein [Microvirga arsenatis]